MAKLAKSGSQPRSRQHPAKSDRKRAMRCKASAGTTLATKGEEIGSALSRSRETRPSSYLSKAAAENIIAAAQHAALTGRPLNRFTTLHYEAAKVSDPVKATGRLLKLASDWLRTKGEPLFAIWVRETGIEKGEHLHLLWHVPNKLAKTFANRERRWRNKIGMKLAAGASYSRPVGLSYRHALRRTEYGECYADHLLAAVGYVLKGAHPRTVESLGLPRCEPQGLIAGKRSGMTENLNRKARAHSCRGREQGGGRWNSPAVSAGHRRRSADP